MSHSLDHLIIVVNDLDQAILDYQQKGFTVLKGGVHANNATHNALICFQDGTYIELLARTGQSPKPNMIDFGRVCDKGEGLKGYALRSDDLDTEKVRLQQTGVVLGDILAGQRLRGDGVLIQWKLALVNDDFAPFFIQDVTPREWRVANDLASITHANGAMGLDNVDANQSLHEYDLTQRLVFS